MKRGSGFSHSRLIHWGCNTVTHRHLCLALCCGCTRISFSRYCVLASVSIGQHIFFTVKDELMMVNHYCKKQTKKYVVLSDIPSGLWCKLLDKKQTIKCKCLKGITKILKTKQIENGRYSMYEDMFMGMWVILEI